MSQPPIRVALTMATPVRTHETQDTGAIRIQLRVQAGGGILPALAHECLGADRLLYHSDAGLLHDRSQLLANLT